MYQILKGKPYCLMVDGATIRAIGRSEGKGNDKPKVITYRIGVATILPKVQMVLGAELPFFRRALELSRIPIALKKTMENGSFVTYDIYRLPTGNVEEAVICSVSTYNDVVIAITYNRELLSNRTFRKYVQLSAMHQMVVCEDNDPAKLLKVTDCVSKLTGVDREKLIVVERAKNLRVRVGYKEGPGIPIYYTFSLGNTHRYNLAQIAFDFNEYIRAKGK